MASSDDDLNKLDTLSDDDYLKLIEQFYEKNVNNFAFPQLDLDKKQRLVTELFTRLRSFDSNSIFLCLKTLRLLTRDREGLDALTGSSVLEPLQKLAGLECSKVDANPTDIQNVIEAEKCMSNLIYMSPAVQKFYSVSGVADAITQRIKETTTTKLDNGIRFFDMRMLFLLTALNADIRQRVREKFHGLSYLFEIINQIMSTRSEPVAAADSGITLSNEDIDYLIEILKTLYNLTVDLPNLTHSYAIQEEEEEAHLMRLVSILRELLLCYGPNNEKQMELQNHIINLLTNMPKTCFEELLSPAVLDDDNDNDEHNGKNMEAINTILRFLDHRIAKAEGTKNAKEVLLPVLQLLILMCQSNRTIRKFCRQFILPALGDEVLNLPTEGQKLRNKLTRMMTNPNSELKTLSAKLLFVLCKESVDRLIKYTGYGNAAGLLYDFGLLGPQHNINKEQYSSDSDESDTESYKKIRDQYGIDGVTGRANIKRNDDAMKDWTEERKMVEVDKLLNTLDRAMTHGLIKPMVMDANGNPVPAESVLQLREANLLTHHPNDLRASESSDDEGDGGQINTNKSK
ncbi:unnamed protein product [Adineta steineri]|uniref:Synembryn-A n=5 Tax=Adineta steineri TaxID=433720 RepID=A0A819E9W3_9BILA|nr:unnamed protein product [Adineta steineri]CAF0841480.1 unnamed protein product [Adineta steineri]CAF3600964.1 unnamed protein product [Adineta steineri]CAF3817045.1 unnamed protein product [Adineta steineri]CAF3846788.1 unnamed protein product [Adineta steineri]